MSREQEVQAHFDDFIGYVGPKSHPAQRDEYAQYCRGIVDASVIVGAVTIQRAREMRELIQQTRDAQ